MTTEWPRGRLPLRADSMRAGGYTVIVQIAITEEPTSALAEYARIPIAFTIQAVLEVTGGPAAGFTFAEQPVRTPSTKDYDAIPGNHPTEWAQRFDITNWGILAASVAGERVGGAVIAFDTPGVEMLDGMSDLAVLWDLRVHPQFRRNGIGAALFARAQEWERVHGAENRNAGCQPARLPVLPAARMRVDRPESRCLPVTPRRSATDLA